MAYKIGLFTHIVLRNRVTALTELAEAIVQHKVTEREQFTDLIRSVVHPMSGIQKQELAGAFGFSAATVSRWVTGENVPHNALWDAIVEWSLQSTLSKLEESKSQLLRMEDE